MCGQHPSILLGSDILAIDVPTILYVLQIVQVFCEKYDNCQHPSSWAGAILYIIMVILCIRQFSNVYIYINTKTEEFIFYIL